MSTLPTRYSGDTDSSSAIIKRNRIESIDLLRGIVMIIMALDHVRDYFHRDAFLYSPTDLTQTTGFLFFTRYITHYCAPVFVFLAGLSACLYGTKKSRKQLSHYLFTRGIWLVFVEFFIVSLGQTFNPAYPMFNLQVIWAIGIGMIVLSALVFLDRQMILISAVVCIAAHNLMDEVHVPGTGVASFLWAFVHEPRDFFLGPFSFQIHYPVLPWIGILALGYYFGNLYMPGYDPGTRRTQLLFLGVAAICLFVILRSGNFYGDAAHWSVQKNALFSILSFLNSTKYPPSLLYTLITLGPALILLALAEKPLNNLAEKIVVFGRVPMFYYVIHIYLIHFLAVIGAVVSGYQWSDMILTGRVNSVEKLKGYGFELPIVYLIWMGLVLFLYPCCHWFDRYKRAHQSTHWWLSYV